MQHLRNRLRPNGFTTHVVTAAGHDDRPSLVAVGPWPAGPDRRAHRPPRHRRRRGHARPVHPDRRGRPPQRRGAERHEGRRRGDGRGCRGTGPARLHPAGSCSRSSPTRRTPAGAPRRCIAALPGLGIHPDVAVVGEPTWLALTESLRGYALVEVTLSGRAAHSSQPELGRQRRRPPRPARSRPSSSATRQLGGRGAVAHGHRRLAAATPRSSWPARPGAWSSGAPCRASAPTPRSPRSSSCSRPAATDDRSTATAPARRRPRGRGALDATGPAAVPVGRPRSSAGRRRPEPRCAATLPRALLDGGAALAGGRHARPGLRTGGRRPARGRRVGRPRPGAAVRRRPDRGGRAVGGRRSVPTDPRRLRGDAPLLDAWLRFQEEAPTPFTIPGHKQRRDLVGDVVAGDVPLYAGLDTMKLARGVVADAEARAARLWGADLCRFSVGGVDPRQPGPRAGRGAGRGDRVVVGRTLHRSMLLGLVLAGLEPVWVRPDVDPATRAARSASPPPPSRPRLAGAPDARAVLRRRPVLRRHGRRRRRRWPTVAHAHGVPLVVDAAWAAHFGFHPALPPHALAARRRRPGGQRPQDAARLEPGGAGAGAHRPDRPGPARRRRRGHRHDQPGGRDPREHRRRPRAARARRRGPARRRDRRRGRRRATGCATSTAWSSLDGPGVDPLKLTLVLAGTGADGNAVEADLLAARAAGRDGRPRHRRRAWCPSPTPPDGAGRPRRRPGRVGRRGTAAGPAPVVDPRRCGPSTRSPSPARGRRSSRRRESVAVEQAVGRVSAELVAPYPPGIPVLAPGEEVTLDAVDALRAARAAGSRIAYAADPTVHTLDVIAE